MQLTGLKNNPPEFPTSHLIDEQYFTKHYSFCKKFKSQNHF
jgi:hypothetical protein